MGVVAPAQADPYQLPTIDDPAPEEPGTGGGSGGGTTAAYVLQGVIQTEGTESDGTARRMKLRGYSRFATPGNDRRDADYINVQCTATAQTGAVTGEYDSENGGALVDVHFGSPWIPNGAFLRSVHVACTHYATKSGVVYETTSAADITIPY
ncbi:hypothetical protein DV20_12015 [Amycolatopsis rifamycinica]|uniref:Uncharacterized protein n=1 Tax=Amycolatopsis rifamycinica TaxID=287986 RepID=A0A066U3R3_9PSEU|nr:hypothetical protein DV20_12015 [Amycolatopsis rifamycinica]